MCTRLCSERRRLFIGGSDARIIMGSDEAALVHLWREKPRSLKRRASTRASSRSLRRAVIATGSICVMSPNRLASCAAASPRIHTTSDSPSRVRSAARSAMSSRSHSGAGIIVRCTAHATSARGGGRPASTRSRLPAGYGKRHTEWRNVRLDVRPDRMAVPHPGSQRTTPPPQPHKKPPCRIFSASRDRPAGCSRIVNVEA
jgi:hypothetical protein